MFDATAYGMPNSVFEDLGLYCFTTWERWHSDVDALFWMMPRH
jgi:hypothetical protein